MKRQGSQRGQQWSGESDARGQSQTGRRRHMVKDRNIVVVQYPRGATALVWLDPASRAVVSSHAGLSSLLHQGVRDWEGRLVFPDRGQDFLAAVYDRLFINGCAVQWVSASASVNVQRSYRV